MAIFKLITDCDCDLYIDQEFIRHINKNTLHKVSLPFGSFLIDVVSSGNINATRSFEVSFIDANQQILKRINFEDLSPENNSYSSEEVLYNGLNSKLVRKGKELLLYGDNNSIQKKYFLCGEINGNSPIPVSKEVGYMRVFGYVNKRGNEIMPFIYESVSNFSDSGYAEVQRFGIKRYINKDGQVCILNTLEEIEKKNELFCILDDKYEWCGRIETSAPNSYFLSGCYRIAVLKEGKWGYCYLKKGYDNRIEMHELLPFEYDYPFFDSKYGFVIMRQGRYLCVVNLIDAKYNSGSKKGEYIYGKFGEILYQFDAEELYPIMSLEREWESDGRGGGWLCNIYKIERFVIKCNGKYGVINLDGSFSQRCVFDDIYYKTEKEQCHDFLHNIGICKKGDTMSLINLYGVVIIDAHGNDIFKNWRFLGY